MDFSDIKKVEDFLKKLEIHYLEAPIKLQPILEKLQIVLEIGNLKIDDEKISGAIKKKKSGEGATILLNSGDVFERQRFTIAHEIAHYIFEMQQSNENVIIETRSYKNSDLVKEIRADKFAAELLMPKELILKEYDSLIFPTISEIARKFEVSKPAMRIRLKELGLGTYD